MVRIHCLLEYIVFWQFYSLFSHLFSIKLLFLCYRDPWYRSPQMDFCPAAAVWSCSLQQSGDAKRMVRIYFILTIFQLFHSPVFQLNCYFWGLSPDQWYHSPMTDFCPAADTTGSRSSVKSRAAKRMVRKCYKVRNLHCFSLTILSITIQSSLWWI